MSTQAKFFFTGNSDQFTKALSQVKKSMKQVATQTVALQAALKVLSGTIKTVAKTLTNVLGAAVRGIVNLISAAIRTIKNLITGVVKFVKSALTTLLSWITKALGKIFDWLGNTIKKLFSTMASIASTAFKIAKKAVKEVIDSVQKYADKEYNQIQLKVSLGDAYESVMKDFNQLLKMTTSDKNELLSVYSTYAELGKSPEDVLKYSKATVYLANATGRSLSQITRLLLGQEAAGRDLEKVLGRIGITLTGNEESVSNVEKIIRQLDNEMQALADSSLSQIFANIKNDIVGIKENIGQIFSGPVRYVAKEIEKIFDSIANSDKVEELANKVDKLFSDKIKPVVDDIIKYFKKILNDPAGFFEAVWKDIKANWTWVIDNFHGIIKTFGELIGHVFKDIGILITNIPWDKVWESMKGLGEALSGFIIQIGHGVGIFTDEDLEGAEGKLSTVMKNAWNRAHPDFTLSENDKWYQTLGKLVGGVLDDLNDGFVDWWNGLDWDFAKNIKLSEEDPWYKNLVTLLSGIWDNVLWPKISSLWTDFKDIWGTYISPVLDETFKWLGQVLGGTFTNIVLKSDVFKKIMSALGMPMVSSSDRDEIYSLLNSKGFLPQGMTLDQFRNIDMNKHEDWMVGYATWQDMIGIWGQSKYFTEEEHDLIRRYARAGEVVEEQVIPSLTDLFDAIDKRLNPVVEDMTQAVTDANKAFREIDKATSTKLITGFVGGGFGGGGVHAFAKGGLVHKPTLALIGEEGPEIVIPVKNLTKLADGSDKSVLPIDTDWYSNAWSNAAADAGVNLGSAPGAQNTKAFFDSEEDAVEEGVKRALKDVIEIEIPAFQKFVDTPKFGKILIGAGKLLMKIGNWIPKAYDTVVEYFKSWGESWYKAFDNLTDIFELIPKLGLNILGYLAGGGGEEVHAFGTHIGHIYTRSFDEEGGFSILKMFSAIIQELLPYLQKGLDIIAPLFDEAFEILGNAVQILGERVGKMLLPILEAFIPFMKTLADIVIALSPVVESVLAPAIKIVAAVLEVLTTVLDKLMPVFAFLGATIQWISERIEYAIAGVINWLASWIPWVSSVEQKKPKSWQENYDNIMGTYNASKANTVSTPTTSSVGTASATASYNGATTVYMTNDFSGAYVVGSNGFRELALIIKNTLEDIDYSGQSV